jgi:hypothetical protein
MKVIQNQKDVSWTVVPIKSVIDSSFEIGILNSTPRHKGYKNLYDFGIQSSSRILLQVALMSKCVQIA